MRWADTDSEDSDDEFQLARPTGGAGPAIAFVDLSVSSRRSIFVFAFGPCPSSLHLFFLIYLRRIPVRKIRGTRSPPRSSQLRTTMTIDPSPLPHRLRNRKSLTTGMTMMTPRRRGRSGRSWKTSAGRGRRRRGDVRRSCDDNSR